MPYTNSQTDKLIADLQAADEGSRELDLAIHSLLIVKELKHASIANATDLDGNYVFVPSRTTSIDAAMTTMSDISNFLTLEQETRFENGEYKDYYQCLQSTDETGIISSDHYHCKNPIHAMCKAIIICSLKAMKAGA